MFNLFEKRFTNYVNWLSEPNIYIKKEDLIDFMNFINYLGETKYCFGIKDPNNDIKIFMIHKDKVSSESSKSQSYNSSSSSDIELIINTILSDNR